MDSKEFPTELFTIVRELTTDERMQTNVLNCTILKSSVRSAISFKKTCRNWFVKENEFFSPKKHHEKNTFPWWVTFCSPSRYVMGRSQLRRNLSNFIEILHGRKLNHQWFKFTQKGQRHYRKVNLTRFWVFLDWICQKLTAVVGGKF